MRPVVGIDTRMIRHTGIGTYLRGILTPMLQSGSGGDFEIRLFGPEDSDIPPSVRREDFRAPIYSLREQAEYPSKLNGCRLWHAPHYNVPLVKGARKLVVTVHDLIHWIFRKDSFSPAKTLYAGIMMRAAVSKADHIIAVSERTKADLIEHFGADPAKISVIYEGVGARFLAPPAPEADRNCLEKMGLRDPFFLYVGLLKPHKQVERLIRVFRKLRGSGKTDARLVIVGRKDRKYPAGYEDLQNLTSGEEIVYLPQAGGRELLALYGRAAALVHPSKYEGFGLTLLEAMARDTPVIACRAASIPEVTGEAALLVDPASDEALEEAMTKILNDRTLCDTLRAKGRERVSLFQWKDAARKTADVYRKVLGDL